MHSYIIIYMHTPKYMQVHVLTKIMHFYTDELPTLDELLIRKYTDEGKKHKVRISNEASHKWKDIANLICGEVNVTNILKEKCCGDPSECLKRTFIDYFVSKKPQGYSYSRLERTD
jgi:hypothetical protein